MGDSGLAEGVKQRVVAKVQSRGDRHAGPNPFFEYADAAGTRTGVSAAQD